MNMRERNMTNTKNIDLTDERVIADPEMERQIAHAISAVLDKRAQHIEPEHERRLQAARDAAVNLVAERQARYTTSQQIGGRGGVLHWFGHLGQGFEQHRMASTALLLVVMLLTFFAVQQFGMNHNLENSDAFLLASDLPPEAYADKGFDAWIQSN